MKPWIISVAIVIAVIAVLLFAFLTADDTSDDDIPAGGDYLYAVYTDPIANINVVDVYESHDDGDGPTPMQQRYRSSIGLDGINGNWRFDTETGLGPFNSFYAAINLMDDCEEYRSDDSNEKRLSTSAGRIAYILDPGDLGSTLSGHTFNGRLYNIMLVIPTVYWTSARIVQDVSIGNLVKGLEYNVLFMSSSPGYELPDGTVVEDMIPYAHSASLEEGIADFTSNVYPYLCLGVYESSLTTAEYAVGEGKLVSQSGTVISHAKTVDEYKSYADALTPAASKDLPSAYQQWNFYQWTLYKMMCYTVIGCKNVQIMVGMGYCSDENTSAAITGSTDTVGFVGLAPYTVSESGEVTSEDGRVSGKLFIENGWGSVNEFVGDTFVEGYRADDQHLHAGNYLGGRPMIDSRTQPDTGGIWADVSDSKWIISTGASAMVWDMPFTTERTWHDKDPGYPGDLVNSGSSGVYSLVVGGNWDHGVYDGLAFACGGYAIDYTVDYRGARLAYLLGSE